MYVGIPGVVPLGFGSRVLGQKVEDEVGKTCPSLEKLKLRARKRSSN